MDFRASIVAVLAADVGPDHNLAVGLAVANPVEHRLAVKILWLANGVFQKVHDGGGQPLQMPTPF